MKKTLLSLPFFPILLRSSIAILSHEKKSLIILFLMLILTGCGFHFQGKWQLSPHVRTIYIDTNNPYGNLSKELKQQLKYSNVIVVDNQANADIILAIEQDTINQTLLGINATQQTRQYKLTSTIRFSLSDNKGVMISPSQTVEDNRVITIQSNQILGSSNEVLLFAQQMRRSLSINILNILTSHNTERLINQHFPVKTTS